MKTKQVEVNTPDLTSDQADNISRKEALVKVGKYAAFTAGTMVLILSPKKAQASSVSPENPGGGW